MNIGGNKWLTNRFAIVVEDHYAIVPNALTCGSDAVYKYFIFILRATFLYIGDEQVMRNRMM